MLLGTAALLAGPSVGLPYASLPTGSQPRPSETLQAAGSGGLFSIACSGRDAQPFGTETAARIDARSFQRA